MSISTQPHGGIPPEASIGPSVQRPDNLSMEFRVRRRKLGQTHNLESAHDLHDAADESLTFVRAAHDSMFFEACGTWGR